MSIADVGSLRSLRCNHPLQDPTEHTNLASDPKYATILSRMLARAHYFDTTVFQSEGGDISKPDPAATKQAIANGGFWGPWQPDTPFPSPAPSKPTPAPVPTPAPAPTPSFTLKWADGATCLSVTKLGKGGEATLGKCTDNEAAWNADSAGRLFATHATDQDKKYLRPKYPDVCKLGNFAALGIDGEDDSIYTAYDAKTQSLVMHSCDGLCLGGSLVNGVYPLVKCSDAASAQHWTKH